MHRVAIAAVLSAASSVLAHEITLQPQQRHQQIEGWGTSGVVDDPRWRAAYRDLGLNIIRVPMAKEVLVDASGDYRVPVTLGTDMAANIAKTNFDIASVKSYGQFAQWLTANPLPGEQGRIHVVTDCWSPPHWMKGPTGQSQSWIGNWGNSLGQTAYPTPWLSNEHNGWGGFGHSGDSIGGRLRTEDPDNLVQYGRYMATWVSGFQQRYGVPVYGMSLQNESTYENPFDSMNYIVDQYGNRDPGQYAMGLAAVRGAWQQFGIQTKVVGPHVATFGSATNNPWGLWNQMSMIQGVKDYSDPTLINFLHGYNSNYYMGYNENAVKLTAGYIQGGANVPADWGWYTPPGVIQDGKAVWYSETGDGGTNWLTQNGNPGALAMAQKIQNALVYGEASAYIYWQMTDGADPSTYSLLGTNQFDDPMASKKYAAFMQFSRYVRPGADRIGTIFENGAASIGGADEYDTEHALNVSAFINDEDHTLTIVLVNMLATAQPITMDVPADLGASSFMVFRTTETDSFLQLADLQVVDGQVQFDMAPYSVLTLTASVPEPAVLGALAALGSVLLRRKPR